MYRLLLLGILGMGSLLPLACNALLPDQAPAGLCGAAACDGGPDGTLEGDAPTGRIDGAADGTLDVETDGADGSLDGTTPDGGPPDAGGDAATCAVTLAQPQLNVLLGGSSGLGVSVAGEGCTLASLMVSGVPAGMTVDVSDGGASGTLTFSAGASAPFGPALVTVGTGSATASAALTLLVESLPGAVDTTFGDGGKTFVTVPGGSTNLTWTGALTMTAEGGVLVTGNIPNPNLCSSCYAIAMAKLDEHGALDPAFGSQGKSIQTPPGTTSTPLGTVPEPGGGILTLGFSQSPTSNRSFAIAEFSALGRAETTFGSGGFFTLDLGEESKLYAGALQDDGKLIAGGFAGGSGLLLRTSPEGGLDTSFGAPDAEGIQLSASAIYGLQPLSTGSFIVMEVPGGQLTLLRYSRDGILDPTYGTSGSALGASVNGASSLVVEPDDAVIVATDVVGEDAGLGPIFLTRFRADGSLDLGFADGGVSWPVVPIGYAQLYDIKRGPDGRLAAAFSGTINGAPTFGVARFTSTGALDTSFGGGFAAAGAVARPWIDNYGVAIDSYGRILVAGIVQDPNDSTSVDILVARFWP